MSYILYDLYSLSRSFPIMTYVTTIIRFFLWYLCFRNKIIIAKQIIPRLFAKTRRHMRTNENWWCNEEWIKVNNSQSRLMKFLIFRLCSLFPRTCGRQVSTPSRGYKKYRERERGKNASSTYFSFDNQIRSGRRKDLLPPGEIKTQRKEAEKKIALRRGNEVARLEQKRGETRPPLQASQHRVF